MRAAVAKKAAVMAPHGQRVTMRPRCSVQSQAKRPTAGALRRSLSCSEHPPPRRYRRRRQRPQHGTRRCRRLAPPMESRSRRRRASKRACDARGCGNRAPTALGATSDSLPRPLPSHQPPIRRHPLPAPPAMRGRKRLSQHRRHPRCPKRAKLSQHHLRPPRLLARNLQGEFLLVLSHCFNPSLPLIEGTQP